MCKPKAPIRAIISQQCVVYNSKCDLCDAEYVCYTIRRLHQRIDEHRYSAIIKHLKNDNGLETIGDLTHNVSVLKKWNGKLDCLIYEMFFINKKRPYLEHIIRFHTRKTIYLNMSLFMCIFLRFIASYGIHYVVEFLFPFYLKMMTWSQRNVLLFLSLDV